MSERGKPRTILVTGASGVLGRHVLPRLRRAGWRTRCLVHRSAVQDCDEVVHGDLADVDAVRRAVASVDAVMHLAAVIHARNPRRYAEVNVDGTRALLAAAPPTLTRFVHVSTRAISPEGGAYSRSKLAAEDAVRSSRLPWVIVRPGEVYGGSGTKGMGVDDIIDRARRGALIPVVGSGEQELCPVHIDDLVNGLVAAASAFSAVHKTYNLVGECMTVREFALRASAVFGKPSRVIGIPRSLVLVAGKLSRFVPLPLYPDQLESLESSKPASDPSSSRDLGFVGRPLEVALAS